MFEDIVIKHNREKNNKLLNRDCDESVKKWKDIEDIGMDKSKKKLTAWK